MLMDQAKITTTPVSHLKLEKNKKKQGNAIIEMRSSEGNWPGYLGLPRAMSCNGRGNPVQHRTSVVRAAWWFLGSWLIAVKKYRWRVWA